MRISDWSSDVCSSDLRLRHLAQGSPLSTYLLLMADLADAQHQALGQCAVPGADNERIELAQAHGMPPLQATGWRRDPAWHAVLDGLLDHMGQLRGLPPQAAHIVQGLKSSEEHTSEIQSLMRNSYAVFRLKTK